MDCGGEDVLQIIRAVFIKIADVFCTMCSPDLKDLLEAVQASIRFGANPKICMLSTWRGLLFTEEHF